MITYNTEVEAAEALRDAYKRMMAETQKVIIGQDDVVTDVLNCIFCNGHVLLVGVPGLAKTLLVKTISEVLDLSFNRIQFTPDLMPGDISGSEILENTILILLQFPNRQMGERFYFRKRECRLVLH